MKNKLKIMLEYLENEQNKYADNIIYCNKYAEECDNETSKKWWINQATKNENYLHITNEHLQALREIAKRG